GSRSATSVTARRRRRGGPVGRSGGPVGRSGTLQQDGSRAPPPDSFQPEGGPGPSGAFQPEGPSPVPGGECRPPAPGSGPSGEFQSGGSSSRSRRRRGRDGPGGGPGRWVAGQPSAPPPVPSLMPASVTDAAVGPVLARRNGPAGGRVQS